MISLLLYGKELENSKKRFDKSVDMYLSKDIDKETYNKKSELTREISLLENQIANFNNNSEDVHITMKHLLEVASRIYELYMSSYIDRKRKILKLVFPNFWLGGQNLSYELKKLFDEFIKKACYLLNWTLSYD